MKQIWGIACMALITAGGIAHGQKPAPDSAHYSAAELQQSAQKLAQQESLKTSGTAGETLERYSNHYTMLTMRTVSGGAEVHEHYFDIFFVVDGNATLVTGGIVAHPTEAGPGEIRGAEVQGGRQQQLAKGDVVHISPGEPHQLLIAKGQSFTYFVVKIHD